MVSDEIDDYDPEEEEDLVLFKGALDGQAADLSRHARIAQAGMHPAKELITDAILRRGEAVWLEPRGAASVVRLFIDGVAYPGGRLPRPQAMAVTKVLRLLSGLSAKPRAKVERGGVKAELDGVPYELRFEFEVADAGAEKLRIKLKNLKEGEKTPADLGINDDLRGRIREATGRKQGILCVCAPPKMELTSIAMAVLKSVDIYVYSVFLVVDPGREVPMVTPFFEDKEPGESLRIKIERCMRRDPDVIYAGRLKDAETFSMLAEYAAETSVVVEMLAKDTVGGLGQLLKLAGNGSSVAEHVSAIMSPKMLRKLCESCRQAFRPNPKVLAKVGLPKETKILYRAAKPPAPDDPEAEDFEPCEACGGTGYRGQIGIFEFLEMSDSMREVLRVNPDASKVRQLMKGEKMPTFQREGLRLVAEGVTSLEELQRVFRSE